MKTLLSNRILTMSFVALVAFGFTSKSLAVSFPFQKIEIKYSDGSVTKVSVDENGNFTTPALKAGTYTFSWSLVSTPTTSEAAVFGVGRGIGSPMGGGADRESSAPSVSEIVVTKVEASCNVKSPYDIATGQASGKRMHKPFTISKEIDKTSPLLSTQLGSFTIDNDGDTMTGSLSYKNKAGTPVKATYDVKSMSK